MWSGSFSSGIPEIDWSNSMEKICFFCRHFLYKPGQSEHGRAIPGGGYEILQKYVAPFFVCSKGLWTISSAIPVVEFRKLMATALNCKNLTIDHKALLMFTNNQ